MPCTLGADLGKRQDPSALAICEPIGPERHLRHLERLPLGTPYHEVVRRIGELMGVPPLSDDGRLVVDATGVGTAVVEIMHEADLTPIPVVFTGGKNARRRDGSWYVPKKALVWGLAASLESGRLKVAEGLEHGPALVRELRAFHRLSTTARGSKYGGKGEHDDLVIAAALSLWPTRIHDGENGV